jgi:hypothetical protein
LAVPAFAGGGNLNLPPEIVGIVFLLIAIIGFLTIFKLIRLRQAWHSSVTAMNAIKNFYLKNFPEFASALHWRADTIPAHDKPWTITFILSLLVVLIDTAALGGGVYLLTLSVGRVGLAITVGAIILGVFLQAAFYSNQLGGSESDVLAGRRKPPQTITETSGEAVK